MLEWFDKALATLGEVWQWQQQGKVNAQALDPA